MNEDEKSRYRAELEARQQALEEIRRGTTEARQPVQLDQTRVGRLSRMDALQGQAMAIETERRRQVELARIRAALARLGSDDYGYCTRCGEEISKKRLDLDPAIPICIECAR